MRPPNEVIRNAVGQPKLIAPRARNWVENAPPLSSVSGMLVTIAYAFSQVTPRTAASARKRFCIVSFPATTCGNTSSWPRKL